MSKEKYFGASIGAGDFMWGKGLDVSDKDRCGVYRSSEKIVPKFARGGGVGESEGRERYDNYAEMNRIHDREEAEERNNRDEMRRIHGRARMEHHEEMPRHDEMPRRHEMRHRDDMGRFARGGPIKKGMFNNPNIHKGGLHESLGVPEGKKIGNKKIMKAEHSKSPLIRKQAVLAENMMHSRKK